MMVSVLERNYDGDERGDVPRVGEAFILTTAGVWPDAVWTLASTALAAF